MKNRFHNKDTEYDFLQVYDKEKKDYLTGRDIINTLNHLNDELEYTRIRFLQTLFNTNNRDMKITERYTYNDDFPHDIRDTKNKYGSYVRLIGLREACALLNDYENVLRYREEKINRLITCEEQLKPIKAVCEKYNIPIADLPLTLEEYILQDNEGWSD